MSIITRPSLPSLPASCITPHRLGLLQALRCSALRLNGIACAIAGGFGVHLVWSGLRYLTVKSGHEPNLGILKTWALIYMFVGTQLAWTLRPFVNAGGHFVLFRQLEGDFYISLFRLLARLAGG